MSPETYKLVCIITASISCGYFLLLALLSLSAIRKIQLAYANWHILMCVSTLAYSITLIWGFITPDVGRVSIMLCTLFGISTFFFYMKAITHYLETDSASLKFSRRLSLVLPAAIIINFITTSAAGWDFMYDPWPADLAKPFFTETFGIDVNKNAIAMALDVLGMIAILVGCGKLLTILSSRPALDKILFAGVLVTLACLFNDILLSMHLSITLIPIFFVSSMFEGYRFTSEALLSSHRHSEKLAAENKLQEKELDAVRLSQRLLHILSHDIKNGVVLAELAFENMSDKFPNNEEVQKDLKRLGRGIEIITTISQNSNRYESILRGVVDRNSHYKIDREVIEDMVNNFEYAITRKSLRVDISFETTQAPTIDFEPDFLKYNILGNFISNAIKYSPEGGVIKLNICENDGELTFSVHDQGCGVDAKTSEALNSLFAGDQNERQVQKSQKGSFGEQGTGLGLLVAHRVSQSLGGRISLKSENGDKGSFAEFSVHFKSISSEQGPNAVSI